MEFEWSEPKRLAVLAASRLDFLDGRRLFDGRPICTAPSPRGAQERWVSIGELEYEIIAIVWTWRGSAIRIITMRKARDEEKRRYRALYRGGNR
jgi:uncharacterized DUF497 family protein